MLQETDSRTDVMKDYPLMAQQFPNQVQCIFLRNTSGTDPGDKFPYDTSGFKDLNQQKYMFFLHPDDLSNLDIANGHCYNSSIAQNLTFGYQGLPFGIGDKPSAVNASATGAANKTGKSGASGFSSKDAVGAQSSLALVAALGAAMFMFL
jgi:hypothetical protein